MINQEQFNIGQLLNSKDEGLIELGFELCESLNYSILETFCLVRFPNSKKAEKFNFDNTIAHYEDRLWGTHYNGTVFYYNNDNSYFGIPSYVYNTDIDKNILQFETYQFRNIDSLFWKQYTPNFDIVNFTCIFDKNTIIKWFNDKITYRQLLDNVFIIELHIKTKDEELILHLNSIDIDLYAQYIEFYQSKQCSNNISILSAIKKECKYSFENRNDWKGCEQLRDILIKLTNENDNNR